MFVFVKGTVKFIFTSAKYYILGLNFDIKLSAPNNTQFIAHQVNDKTVSFHKNTYFPFFCHFSFAICHIIIVQNHNKIYKS